MDSPQTRAKIEKAVVSILLQHIANPAFLGEDYLPRLQRFIAETLDSVLSRDNIVLSRAERTRLYEGLVAEILSPGPIQTALEDPSTSQLELYRSGLLKIWRDGFGEPLLTELDRVPRVVEAFKLINNLSVRHDLQIGKDSQKSIDGLSVMLPVARDDNEPIVVLVRGD